MTDRRDEPPAVRPEPPVTRPISRTSGGGRDAAGARRWRTLGPRLGLEFAVVVFGVFIALWADAQVAARAERRIEAARLDALRAGINTTLMELREFSADVRDDRTLLREMLVPPAGDEDTGARSTEAVAIALLGGASAFHPQLVVYDDLRSSGELSLLDAGVRGTLSSMDQRLRRLDGAQQDLTMVQQLNFDAFAMRNVDLVPLLGGYLELTEEVEPPSRAQYDALVATREFRNLAVFRLDLLTNILRLAGELEEALETASAAVDERLGQLR